MSEKQTSSEPFTYAIYDLKTAMVYIEVLREELNKKDFVIKDLIMKQDIMHGFMTEAFNQREKAESLLAQRDAEIVGLKILLRDEVAFADKLMNQKIALRSQLAKAEKVIEAARPTLVFHYDSTVQIDYQRALEKAMNTYDQPAPIRKEGEGKEV